MIFSVFQKESVGTCDILLVSENCWRFVFLNPVGIRNIIGFRNSSDGILIDFVVYCKEPMVQWELVFCWLSTTNHWKLEILRGCIQPMELVIFVGFETVGTCNILGVYEHQWELTVVVGFERQLKLIFWGALLKVETNIDIRWWSAKKINIDSMYFP